MLTKMGFIWDEDVVWLNEIYTYLLQYKYKFGDLFVPKYYVAEDDYPLGLSVERIREVCKGVDKSHRKLHDEEIQMLDNIGFVWDEKLENTIWFDGFYKELVEYKAIIGSFEGVMNDEVLGPQVKSFVKYYHRQQIGAPTKHEITKEMISKLKKIGFNLSDLRKIDYDDEDENDLTL